MFEPPAGLKETKGTTLESADKEWVASTREGAFAARVSLARSKNTGTVEPADLATFARGMPAVLETEGVTWKDIRHETRSGPDGVRVGLIEGECTKKSSFAAGLVAELRYRRLILVFPTDDGTAIATALYGIEDQAKWEPLFEKTVTTARGVAVRVPPPPGWLYVAWGVAGLVLGLLGASVLARLSPAPRPRSKADT